MNHKHFDFYQCNFKETNKGKPGKSREGSGRVALFRASNMPHCYTLECNYYTGKRTNLLYPEYHDNNDFLESEDVNKAKGVEKLSMYSSGPEELRKRALTDSDYANYNTP